MPADHQKICTECGTHFVAGSSQARTCSDLCRKRRTRRFQRDKNAPEYAIAAGPNQAAMQAAVNHAVDDLPDIARELVKDEVRPAVREALSADVLQSIAGVLALVPDATQALADELRAATLEYNEDGTPLLDREGHHVVVADHEARHRAAALIYKYTLGQPGLAPQPEREEVAPITIVFPEGMSGVVHVDSEAEEELPALEPGERHCDICREPKDESEFMAGSDRCIACHEANNARVRAAIEERTGGSE